MLAVLYYYRSITGIEIPDFKLVPTIGEMLRSSAGSITPIVRVVPLNDAMTAEIVENVLQAQLASTPPAEIGMTYSLTHTIQKIREWRQYQNRQTA